MALHYFHDDHRKLDPNSFHPHIVSRQGWAYRGYLFVIALVPLVGLRYDFELVQKLNAVFGSLVMPMIAAALLLLNGRAAWVGRANRNRPWTVLTLVGILWFFAWIGGPRILSALTGTDGG